MARLVTYVGVLLSLAGTLAPAAAQTRAERVEILIDRAADQVDAGKLDDALVSARRAVELAGDGDQSGDALAQLGYVYYVRREAKLAAAALQKAEQVAPEDAYVQDLLGEVLTALGNLDGAVAHLERACRLEPADATHYQCLGSTLRLKGPAAAAVAALRRALELKPDDARTEALLGDVLAGSGNDEGLAHLAKAVALEPHNATHHMYYAAALGRAGQKDEAVAQLRAGAAEPHYRAANVVAEYACQSRWECAAALLRAELKRQPAPWHVGWLTACLVRLGRQPGAAAVLDDYLRAAGDEDRYNCLLVVLRSVANASSCAELLLPRLPDDGDGSELAVLALLHAGRPAEALERLRQRRPPTEADSVSERYREAACLASAGNSDEARRLLGELRSHGQPAQPVLYYAALAYDKLGDTARARQLYQAVLAEAGSDGPWDWESDRLVWRVGEARAYLAKTSAVAPK